MSSTASLIERDLKHIWHPCSQMKDYETLIPLEVVSARGSYIELKDGRKIIDAISSWWCKSLGHQHPRLKKALKAQLEKFEHVILANTTNDTIVALSEKLAQLTPSLNKVFYASDGACAVEIAMKMSLHARKILNEPKRTKFIALENGYHGETIGAMSVSDLGLYRDPFADILFETKYISPLPYVHSTADPLWSNCEFYWQPIEKMLNENAETTTAIILEPIIQAAAGMKMYAQDFLHRLRVWTEKNNVHLIADEIMTGLARTGKMLACEHANIEPDFICLSKGITSGWLPLSAVLTNDAIYQLFYDDYATGKSFLHSHTFSGNALAASVALETLKVIQEEKICERATILGQQMRAHMSEIAQRTNLLKNIRGIGGVIAADLIVNDPNRRLGFEVYCKAVEFGALLRPIGNTIYWVPPLTTNEAELAALRDITERAVMAIKKNH